MAGRAGCVEECHVEGVAVAAAAAAAYHPAEDQGDRVSGGTMEHERKYELLVAFSYSFPVLEPLRAACGRGRAHRRRGGHRGGKRGRRRVVFMGRRHGPPHGAEEGERGPQQPPPRGQVRSPHARHVS